MTEQEAHEVAELKRLVANCAEALAEVVVQSRELSRISTKQRLGSPHLRIAEAAAYLSIKPQTLKRKLKQGQIPFHRQPGTAPYLLKHELDQWLSDPEFLHEEKTVERRPPKINDEFIRRLLKGAKPPDAV